ncbi:MAG: hypothetical protein ACI9ZF_003010 [Bradyrhizobium sp.]|jgi:hypothetical protein
MHSEFEQLIEGLCLLTGDNAPQRLIAGGGITIEGVTFTLMHKPAADAAALFLYADFGQFDLEEQAALYPLILQENMMMLSSRECTFSVSPSRDSVVMIEKISLTAHTPDTLLILLRSLTRRINYFNKHHRAGQLGIRRRRPCNEYLPATPQPTTRTESATTGATNRPVKNLSPRR